MMDSLESTLTLATAKVRTGRHQHRGGRGGDKIIEEEEEYEGTSYGPALCSEGFGNVAAYQGRHGAVRGVSHYHL